MTIDYKKLLNKAEREYDMFSLLWRGKRQSGDEGYELQEELSNYLIEEKITDEWPGTKILYGKELVCFYYINEKTIEILNRVSNIFDWGVCGMPEDLAFYKNGEFHFASISHEKEAWFEKI